MRVYHEVPNNQRLPTNEESVAFRAFCVVMSILTAAVYFQ